jgi:hypothetical protein
LNHELYSLLIQLLQFINLFGAKVHLSTQNFLGATKEKAVSLSPVVVLDGFLHMKVPIAHLLIGSMAEFQQRNQYGQHLLRRWMFGEAQKHQLSYFILGGRGNADSLNKPLLELVLLWKRWKAVKLNGGVIAGRASRICL